MAWQQNLQLPLMKMIESSQTVAEIFLSDSKRSNEVIENCESVKVEMPGRLSASEPLLGGKRASLEQFKILLGDEDLHDSIREASLMFPQLSTVSHTEEEGRADLYLDDFETEKDIIRCKLCGKYGDPSKEKFVCHCYCRNNSNLVHYVCLENHFRFAGQVKHPCKVCATYSTVRSLIPLHRRISFYIERNWPIITVGYAVTSLAIYFIILFLKSCSP